MKPQRVSKLSMQEEQVRCELTWQSLDSQIYRAAFANAQELDKWAAKPEEWMAHRQDTVLGF